ncbi:UNVERIFIED_ORG: hypothetical protein J2Y81_000765 [Paraburkholderia sediminicola]|nr:hypothetical protein [Paraburkholderia sediminicola]
MREQQDKSKKLWFSNSANRFGLVPADLLLDTRLSAVQVRLLLVLMMHAKSDTGISSVTYVAIEDWMDLKERQLRNHFNKLVEYGWLRKQQSGTNRPNEYELILPDFASDDLRVITSRRMTDEQYADKKRLMGERTAKYNREKAQKAAQAHAAERESRNVGLIDSEGVDSIKPAATSPKKSVPLPIFKSRDEVDAALRAYLHTDVQDDSITDDDLARFGVNWGRDPDNEYRYPYSELE